jgi:hypothetical protein
MSEITYQQKELRGLGGWLVLFQIQIWSNLAGTVQMGFLIPLSGIFMRRMFTSVYSDLSYSPFGMFAELNSPIAYAFILVVFVLTLLCIIFFYKRKLAFRVFFILESVIYLVAMGLYYNVMLKFMSAEMTTGYFDFSGMFTGFMIFFGMLPAVGILVAFIIALFKSKRVKNTFS